MIVVNNKIQLFSSKHKNNCFIIAEAGVNHNGDLKKALSMVDVAAEVNADAVKFQTFKSEQVATEKAHMATYQKNNTGKELKQRDFLRDLELPEDFYQPIIERCKQKNILFLSTPHGGVSSVNLLESLKVKAYKIGSGDLTNYLLLKRVAETGKPVILSTGMANLQEVKEAINFVKLNGSKEVAVLHCTTSYPCPPEEVNLSAMITMMNLFDVPVGYSDHTIGPYVAVMAVTLGAKIYECHFTLDKDLPGPDHKASANPKELVEKIKLIRNTPSIMGNPIKKPNISETKELKVLVTRSLVAANDLSKGHVIEFTDLEAKRPGNGVSPKMYHKFLGKKLKKDLKKDQQFKKEYID